jgi:hypothetical protein
MDPSSIFFPIHQSSFNSTLYKGSILMEMFSAFPKLIMNAIWIQRDRLTRSFR